LQQAVDTGQLVPTHRGDDLGLRSLELAFDYGAIAASLPSTRIAEVRRDLEQSILGPISPHETSRGPLQLQSQFVVRAALVRAGVLPVHPRTGGGKSPDLLVENGLSCYGIEAKRPQVAGNVLPRFDDARDQLRDFGLKGAVLVDVTDCIRDTPKHQVDETVRKLALEIYDRVFTTGWGYKEGYEGIVVAGAYARVAWTSADGDAASMVNVHTSSTIGLFTKRRNVLLDHHGRWLRAAFADGLWKLNQTLAERARAA